MKAEILDPKKGNGQIELSDSVFGVKLNRHMLHLVLKAYMANLRQGTQSAKTRGEVAGSGKKPWRQKGTGRARAGSVRSPLWRHGGIVFAPKPRDYRIKVAPAVRLQALLQVLSEKLKENTVKVVREIPSFDGKTKKFVSWLAPLVPARSKTLLVVESANADLERSSRNVPHVKVESYKLLNAHNAILAKNIIFTAGAVEKFQVERGKV